MCATYFASIAVFLFFLCNRYQHFFFLLPGYFLLFVCLMNTCARARYVNEQLTRCTVREKGVEGGNIYSTAATPRFRIQILSLKCIRLDDNTFVFFFFLFYKLHRIRDTSIS